jgi:DNA polymerase IV
MFSLSTKLSEPIPDHMYQHGCTATEMNPGLQFPRVYLLPVHLETDELHTLEEQIPTLTYSADEADVIVGNISKPARALFELRRHKIRFDAPESTEQSDGSPSPKRRKISHTRSLDEGGNTLRVVRLKWLTDSLEREEVLPLDDYLVAEVKRVRNEMPAPQSPQTKVISMPAVSAGVAPEKSGPRHYRSRQTTSAVARPALLQRTTSEDASLPTVPDFLHQPYSCQRPTPSTPPNAGFIDELKTIRKIRVLAGDSIGVRAYSTSIASIAAYPYPLQSPLGKAQCFSDQLLSWWS